MRYIWICSYNHKFKMFDNGISWYRLYFKIRKWHTLGGILFKKPFRIKYLKPDKPQAPLKKGKVRR